MYSLVEQIRSFIILLVIIPFLRKAKLTCIAYWMDVVKPDITSKFLGKAAASDLLAKLSCLAALDENKLLLFPECPNVNLSSLNS